MRVFALPGMVMIAWPPALTSGGAAPQEFRSARFSDTSRPGRAQQRGEASRVCSLSWLMIGQWARKPRIAVQSSRGE